MACAYIGESKQYLNRSIRLSVKQCIRCPSATEVNGLLAEEHSFESLTVEENIYFITYKPLSLVNSFRFGQTFGTR